MLLLFCINIQNKIISVKFKCVGLAHVTCFVLSYTVSGQEHTVYVFPRPNEMHTT